MPFGVDTEYFTPAAESVDGGYVLSVGRDAERDWKTFFAAVRDLDVPVKIACREQLLAGLDVPPNVEVLGVVSRAEYRDLLARAQVVVVATNPVAYPTGQSVLLEAMSMSCCCVVTESPALADYVSDDTVLGVRAHDPTALRAAITRAIDDPTLRHTLGANVCRRVLEQFGAAEMWQRIAALARTLAGTPSGQA